MNIKAKAREIDLALKKERNSERAVFEKLAGLTLREGMKRLPVPVQARLKKAHAQR